MAKAHLPREIIDSASGGFATKPALARAMIERAIAAAVPFSFVAADTVYGVGDIEMALRRAGKGYVLGVKSNDPFRSWGKPRTVAGTAKEIADGLPASAWRRLSAGAGTKGERLDDWAYLELADLDAGEYNETLAGQAWTRGLLIRRKVADGDLAFFTTWAPRGTTIERLAKIEGHRWAIEDSFETTKNELGLDHNETRSWHGWRRHVTLVMLAFAMMAAFKGRWRASRFDARPLPVRRNGRPRQDQPVRRRTCPHGALRSSPLAAHAQSQMAQPSSVGHEDRQASWHGPRPCGGRA
jgi:SRSO17 transposase